MNIIGIIPARGGSKEVPRKNLLKLGNRNLMEIAIDSARKSKLLSRFILSSDDDQIIKVSRDYGCEAPFKRPKNLAQDESSTFSVLKHAVEWLKKNENWNSDVVVLLQPTTPFRTADHIDDVISFLLKSSADAIITVRKPDYPPYWMLNMDKESMKISNIIPGGNSFKRRQDTPISYQPAGMVYAFKTSLLYDMDTLFPFQDTRGFVVSQKESINIDSYLDYLTAKAIWEEKG